MPAIERILIKHIHTGKNQKFADYIKVHPLPGTGTKQDGVKESLQTY